MPLTSGRSICRLNVLMLPSEIGVRLMKSIQLFIAVEGILFVVAGVITYVVGDFTVEKYGMILLLMWM